MNNDLISRSELKKHKFMTQAANGVEIYDIEVVSVCAIDNAPTVERSEGGWIPVSERLPERYKEVIVTDIEVSNTYQSRYIGNGFWECDNGTFKNRVIAWQPLPEPYKKGGAEE